MTARAKVRAARAALALLVCGCGDDGEAAQFVSPVFGGGCEHAQCGEHGVCVEHDDGAPACECEVGYAGARCEACENGFHRDFQNRCLSDERCAEQDENPCAPHGRCVDEEGVIACACDEGYEGPRCNLCAQSFARDELDRCLPLFLSGGRGGAAGTGGPAEPPPGGHCDAGYTGDGCAECASGYHRAGGLCLGDEACELDSCPERATCTVIAGEVACQCEHGFLAPTCDSCDEGLELFEGACVPLPTCSEGLCPEHATCSVENGQTVCTCEGGYTGDVCDACATGFHRDGEGACVADEACEQGMCSAHAQCAVVEGEVECLCEAGWGGAQCERCVDLATESTAFELVTGWPTTPNVCGGRPDELSIARLTLRSREGQGIVQRCAAGSTFHRLDTQHVELEAGPLAAQLVFWQPVVMLSFDYATSLRALSLDVLADGRVVDAIELDAHRSGQLTLALDPPAMTVGLRSRTGFIQNVALDNVVYHYETCR